MCIVYTTERTTEDETECEAIYAALNECAIFIIILVIVAIIFVVVIYPALRRLRKYTRNYMLHSVTGATTIPRKIVPPKHEDVYRALPTFYLG